MSAPFYPKKRFGQHFLTSKQIAAKIVDSVNPGKNDTILEIGPGKGVLTEIINSIECKKRVAVEIDSELIKHLQSNLTNVEILEQDILKFSFSDFFQQPEDKLKILGNIPYNITSPILFHLLDNSKFVSQTVLMMQKEVADRLIAKKDCKEYGILTVLLKAQVNVEKLFVVNRTNFFPQPKVDSMVIRLKFIKNEQDIDNYSLFKTIVKTTFNNRRKMLRNSLQKITDNETLQKIKSVSLKLRPENLSVDDFLALAKEIKSFGD